MKETGRQRWTEERKTGRKAERGGRRETKGGLDEREKIVDPGLRFLFTKEAPMGTACLCLNAWMVGWLPVKEAIIFLSFLWLSLVGTAGPLC